MYTFLDKKGKVIVPAIDQDDNKIKVHPTTKERMTFTCPLDQEFESVLEKARELK